MTELVARPPGATRVVLVRHAETVEETAGVVYGALDVDLSVAGAAHARRLGRMIGALEPVAVYSSPRRRAVDTAAAVAAAAGTRPRIRDGLRELDFGAFEGRRYDDLRVEFPAVYQQWMTEPTEVRFPGGECFADLRNRTVAVLRSVRSTHDDATTVLVTHGGVVRALLGHTLGLRDRDVFRLDQEYGAVNVVDFFGDTPLVRLVNGRW
ncbi:MAG TPA: histidine phosphatase family protein [Mycobacteriales bacterium]